ncbi:MAG: hypothetical protein ACYTAN_18520 [Planctomycetota bacterium]
MSAGPGEYSLDYDLELDESGASVFQGSSNAFRIENLPQTVTVSGAPDIVITIERADSPESVLSGTKVFEDWWEKYGTVSDENEQKEHDAQD